MLVKLEARIKRTMAAIAAEQDPAKLRGLNASLAILTAAKAEMGDDDDDDDKDPDDEDDDEDDEESKSAKAAKAAAKAKGAAEAAKHRAKAAEYKAKAAESEEAAKMAEEDDEEDEARLRTPSTGAITPGAAAAIASQGQIGREALARIESLEKSAEARELTAMIREAKSARRVTPAEAKMLAGKFETERGRNFIRDFIEARPNAIYSGTDAEGAPLPRQSAGIVPADVQAEIDKLVSAANGAGAKLTKEQVNEAVASKSAAKSGQVL